jgi:hypothetical protein
MYTSMHCPNPVSTARSATARTLCPNPASASRQFRDRPFSTDHAVNFTLGLQS